MSSATERIQVIIEAAEKAAAGIIEDAEVQARRYLEESRRRADALAEQRLRAMTDVTDSLLQQAETVKRQSHELIAALDSARGQIENRDRPDLYGSAPAQPQASEPGAPHLQPVEPPAPNLQAVPPTPQAPPPQSGPPVPPGSVPPAPDPPAQAPQTPQPPPVAPPPADGARVLATQMAVAGSTRTEIEIRLRNEFGIADARPILDGILGPE